MTLAEEGDPRTSDVASATAADLEAQGRQLAHASSPGRTLLPSPVAATISFWTRSASLALRVTSVIGGYGFGAAKATTLSSLELGRGILETILHRAGNEALLRSNSELGRGDAETIMEKSLESLHLAMSQVVFWTTAGFAITGTTISTITDVSQLTLSYLDSILGSTESSRAIASIITLIRREFNNPATGQPGEKVGVFDLIVGIVGLAYFQRWSWRLIDEECQRLQVEEILWDVVILNDEETIDYNRIAEGKTIETDGPNDKVIQTIQRHGADDSSDDDEGLPEIRLKRQIMNRLPAGAKVSITTETKTTKTITVDVSGTQPSTLAPPPGVELLEETLLRPSSSQGNQRWSMSSTDQLLQGSSAPQATYRVVYRVNKNKLRSTEMARGDEDSDAPRFIEQINDSDTDISADETAVSDNDNEEHRPAPPSKSPPSLYTGSSLEALEQASTVSRLKQGPVSPLHTRKDTIDSDSRQIFLPRHSLEQSANQKRPRMPASPPASTSSSETPRKKQQSMQSMSKLLSKKSTKEDAKASSSSSTKPSSEKKGGFRNVLKKGSGSTMSNLMAKEGKDAAVPKALTAPKGKPPTQVPSGRATPAIPRSTTTRKQNLTVPNRGPVPKRDPPRPPQGVPQRKPLTTRALAEYEGSIPRSPSRASYISIHERRRDSLVSQTDTFSIHSMDGHRPASPAFARSSMAKSRSERDITQPPPSPSNKDSNHRRAASHIYSPSIYTLKTNESQMSLVPYYQRSPFDADALRSLRRNGTLETMFPRFHLLRNINRYMRFSSAAYGSHFLKVFGISKSMPPMLKALDNTHHEVRSFAHHTQSQPQSILLSSFVDSQGGSDSTGSTETGVPLVHYISIDDESKAVVLACRGTLGFEDVLADMTCDYDDLVWRGKSYKVHKGVHASARRLLYGGDGRVLVTIKAALETNPDYGLVLTGHSLGGAVTALLGVMLSEPVTGGTSFVTSDEPHSRLLPAPGDNSTISHHCLPSGRPIHVYAYGPPATMSPSLRNATRGLITSVVHGQDLVPFLSLGVLHDFQAVALAFKTDNTDAKSEIKQRVWDALQGGLMDKWTGTSKKSEACEEDEQWAFAAFKTLRASMLSEKLLPPGEVFVVETERVLRRDAFVWPDDNNKNQGSNTMDNEGKGKGKESFSYVGRPARRIVLKYVRDVEARFKEVRFGATMLTDHNPAKYEDALDGLRFGVGES